MIDLLPVSIGLPSLARWKQLISEPFLLDTEAFFRAVDVAQAQKDVGADSLHRFHGQCAAQILGVRLASRKTKAVPDT